MNASFGRLYCPNDAFTTLAGAELGGMMDTVDTVDWVVAPDAGGRMLADVLPSSLAAMGAAGFEDMLGLPRCHSVAVLLVDGLGWLQLHEHSADAPFLASLATGSPGKVGFPTTTVTSVSSLGTGKQAGEHGMVGYTFAEPDGALLHPLSWTRRYPGETAKPPSMLTTWPPEQVQPGRTVPERAADAGVSVRMAVPADFEGTGLTRAVLRGAEFRGIHALGDLAAELLSGLESGTPTLCYGYHGQLDMLGHVHGPGSLPWRLHLAQVDQLVRSVAERLPTSAALLVVSDHGMVEFDPANACDADTDPDLLDGVRLLGGEVRARQIYTEPGAQADVRATWLGKLGPDDLVRTRDEAIEAGWFGPVVSASTRERIGDLLAVMRAGGVIRSVVESKESTLLGHHGSLTAAEQYVPMLVAEG